MLIKQVIISGFKSYRDQTAVEPFSAGHNVVVGRNGSGKSNFFYAIRFVLSDFTNLRPEERQRLLHEGAGASVMSAFVEIIFDNTDRRFPIDKDEVSLRRALGLKKDVYYLNRQSTTKTEVMNLLESAGFSRSNPYYIVQQGKIQALTVAKDSERLQLLKEVAGTSVYEDKRRESLKLMQETENRRVKIEEILSYIDERLAELESERDELKEYQNLDREKRSLEYTVYDRELKENAAKLEAVTQKYKDETEESLDADRGLSKRRSQIEEREERLKELKQEMDRLNRQKQQLEADREDCIKKRTQLELDVGDSEESAKNAEHEKASAKQELKQLEKTIKDKQEELTELRPKYQDALGRQEALEKDLLIKERRLTDLRAKQGRSAMFRTKGERDVYLKKQLSGVEKALQEKKKQVAETKQVVHTLEKDVERLEANVQELSQGVESRRHALDKFAAEYNAKTKERDSLQNQRKALQRQEQELATEMNTANDNYSRAKRDLDSTMSRDMAHGLDAVMKLVEDNKIDGVHGPLIELFSADDKVRVAVDVTAGNSLFNVVVDSDETVSRILALMHKKKIPGRISFMPLNRLHVEDHKYPESTDAFPLLARLTYDPAIKQAMKQVFGRTLVCRNMEVAAEIARSNKLDCITLDGDQVSRKGAMTGGYREQHRSRLGAMQKLKQAQEKLDDLEDKFDKVKAQLSEMDQRITMVTGEAERIELNRKQDVETYKSFKEDISHKTEELNTKKKTLESMNKALPKLISDVEEMEVQCQNLRDELGSDMMSQLNRNEQEEVQELEEEVANLKTQSSAAADARTELEIRKNNVENELNNHLKLRHTELTQKVLDVGLENFDSLETSRRKLNEVKAEFDDIKRRLDALDTEIGKAAGEIKEMDQSLEKEKAELKKDEMDLDTRASQRQTMLKKRTALLEKKEEMTRKIRDLGSLPQNAFERHGKESVKQLYKLLAQCNEKLKKYSHVNKKALEQYVSFSEQRDNLQMRKEVLDRSKKAIEELIEHLDQQKDEAIARTFSQVSKNFTDIFGRLTKSTNGKAELVIHTTADEDADDDEQQETPTQNSQAKRDSYTGVGIKVSFTGKKDDVQLVQQLSGGQKSVVALALIFAIQRSDPAPFYLFDEIDSALDDTYRTAVAEMLHELTHSDKEPAQYITTTFHPEMLQKADKFYGITYKNKISYVSVISKAEAVRFVTENQQAEMAEYQQQQAKDQQPLAIEAASEQGQKRKRN